MLKYSTFVTNFETKYSITLLSPTLCVLYSSAVNKVNLLGGQNNMLFTALLYSVLIDSNSQKQTNFNPGLNLDKEVYNFLPGLSLIFIIPTQSNIPWSNNVHWLTQGDQVSDTPLSSHFPVILFNKLNYVIKSYISMVTSYWLWLVIFIFIIFKVIFFIFIAIVATIVRCLKKYYIKL